MIVGKNWARIASPHMTDSELWELSQTPMGQRAIEADQREAFKAANTAKSLTLTDSETGEPLTQFSGPEQRARAYSNPLYKTSEAFRQAVYAAEQNTVTFETEAHAGNLRGGMKGTDAQSMLEAAKQDAARAHVQQLFHRANGNTPEAAIARMQMMELLTSEDPTTQEMVRYATEVHHGEDRPIERELKDVKHSGGVARIQHAPEGVETPDGVLHQSNSRDIDYNTGLYMDGSAPPSGSDDTNSF